MRHSVKIIAILLGLSLSGSLYARPGDKEREKAAQAEEQARRAKIDKQKQITASKNETREREARQKAVNKYVGALKANGGVAPKWAQKSEGAKIYGEIDARFRESKIQAAAQKEAEARAKGLNDTQIEQMLSDMSKDIQTYGKIAPAVANASQKIEDYTPKPAPSSNSNENSFKPVNDPLAGMTGNEIVAWAKAKGLSMQETNDLLKDYEQSRQPVPPTTNSSNSMPSGDYCADPANKSKDVCSYGAGTTGMNYSEYGVPLTRLAWDQQTAIDGGTLRRDYAETSRWDAMGLAYCQQNPTATGCDKYKTVPVATPDSYGNYTTEMQFMSVGSSDFAAKNQASTVDNYIWKANHDQNSAFVLDFLPTNTAGVPLGWKPGDIVSSSRQISAGISSELKNQNKSVYGLVVPYNNNALNVLTTWAEGTDVTEALSKNLNKIDKKVTTVAVGYSQPGAGIQNYILQKGNSEGLDYAVLAAPMGGERLSHGPGQSGLYAGNVNGVNALVIANSKDPATDINFVDSNLWNSGFGWAKNLGHYGNSLLNFISSDNPNGALHGTNCPDGSTCGYPKEKLQEQVIKLFNEPQTAYTQLGVWTYDNRPAVMTGCPLGQSPRVDGNGNSTCVMDPSLNQDPNNYSKFFNRSLPKLRFAREDQIPNFKEYKPGEP